MPETPGLSSNNLATAMWLVARTGCANHPVAHRNHGKRRTLYLSQGSYADPHFHPLTAYQTSARALDSLTSWRPSSLDGFDVSIRPMEATRQVRVRQP